MVAFVGDFGNEAVDIVRQVATGGTPRLVMFGNHDAWTSLTASRLSEPWTEGGNLSAGPAKPVMEQIQAVGDRFLGWNCKPLPGHPVSFIGGRPFSKGGPSWNSVAEFYKCVFGCESREDSVTRTTQAMLSAPQQHAKILVAHSGPAGLSQHPQDICGRDFNVGVPKKRGGKKQQSADWGDRDLQDALRSFREHGRDLDMVVFGHMHDRLQHPKGKRRIMIRQHQQRGTIYLNVAFVPRIRTIARSEQSGAERMHQFTVAQFDGTTVSSIDSIWVGLQHGGGAPHEVSRQHLYRLVSGRAQLWNGFEKRWENGRCLEQSTAQVA